MKYLLVILCLLAACAPIDPELKAIEELRDKLDENQQQVKEKKAVPDSLTMLQLARKLEAYAAGHPKAKETPELIMEAAVLYHSGLGNATKAFSMYSIIGDDYGKHPLAEKAIIQMAAIAQADMYNAEISEKIYKKYLALYPTGEYAKMAREAILFFEMQQDSTGGQLPDTIKKQLD